MLERLLQLLGIRERKRFGLTKEELARMEFDFDEDYSAFDYERMMVKMGQVVGTTATIDVDLAEVKDTPVSDQYALLSQLELNSSSAPSFQTDKDHLINAGQCTSMLLIDYGGELVFGTAFFVAPSTLITAGHVVADAVKKGARLIISLPGVATVDTSKLQNAKIKGAKCTVTGVHFSKNRPQEDIAILECGLISDKFLTITQSTPEPGSIVDIVGYPGHISVEWLRTHPDLDSADASKDVAEKLLPPRTLTVSRGYVLKSNSTVTYYISSVRGMSGACVLSGGKVYGTSNFNQAMLMNRITHRSS